MQIYSLKVVGIRNETSDTVTISFKQPGLKKVKYLPGQYLTLIFRINGRRYIRPYSFSSAPLIDPFLEVTVKRVPGGIVSNHIVDTVKEGDVIEVMEPMGDFILDESKLNPESHIVLWGAGSGITPLMSIAKYALNKDSCSHVTLIYGNKNAEAVIFRDNINKLIEQFPDSFTARHFHTQAVISEDNPDVIQGRINPEKVLSVMQSEGNVANTLHYICGPTGLKESVKSSLAALSVGTEQVFSEDFEVVRNPADFDEITTRNVTIISNGTATNVEVVKGKSILEAGLDALLDMNYSCQTGNCLVCKGRLVKGDVKMIGVTHLPDGLGDSERLLCSAFPTTDGVEIEID